MVEERGVRCSHFDAFRFFTPAARPLNVLMPARERQMELDQPGCLHANMDLADLGYDPVRIETPEGRADYAAHQRSFADRAAPLRDELAHHCAMLLDRAQQPVGLNHAH